MMLLSRSGRNPDVYLPPLRPHDAGVSGYFLALDVIEATRILGERDRRQREFLSANPGYQATCACGHRQLAHDDGAGPCRARRCPCPGFRPVGA